MTIPFGIGGAFIAVPLNVLLTNTGFSAGRIAEVVFLAQLPPWLQIFYAPLVEIGPRRKIWTVILSTLGGLCLAAALFVPAATQLGLFTALVLAGQVLTGLTSACNGGLVGTLMPPELRDRTSGWTNAANLGGSVLGGGLVLTLLRLFGPWAAGALIVFLTVVPSLSALWLPEPRRLPQPALEVFGTVLRDLWRTARTRKGTTGLLFCISPVGTACLLNLYAGLGPDYHVAPWVPEVVNGYWGGLVTAAGALATSHFLLQRLDRRRVYLLSGVLTALVCLVTMVMPMTPVTYTAGALTYLLVTGMCYAAFSAVAYDIVGDAGASAGTQYTLCTAAGNFAIWYVTKIDGVGYNVGKARGLLAADALSNLVGVALLASALYLIARRASRSVPVVRAAA
jgi:MFS family permease